MSLTREVQGFMDNPRVLWEYHDGRYDIRCITNISAARITIGVVNEKIAELLIQTLRVGYSKMQKTSNGHK